MHVHVLPRRFTDFGGVNDEVYDRLEASEAALGASLRTGGGDGSSSGGGGSGARTPEKLTMDADEDRKPRTADEMEREARWLAGYFADTA